MEIKTEEIKENLDKVVGGTDTVTTEASENTNPFADFPRVDNNPYTPEVTDRA